MPGARKPLRDHAYDAAMVLMRPLERSVARSSLVAERPLLDPAVLPWTRALEGSWREIRAELDELLVHRRHLPRMHDITPDAGTISRDDSWRTYFFRGYGFRAEANCRRCPRTAALLDSIPDVPTAFFSILEPGARLPRHRGPWKGVLRYHLGLMVPEPAGSCGIEVGGERVVWSEGRGVLFDDSYEHTAWNEGSGPRVILFLDVLRPCRPPGSWINRGVVRAVGASPFLRDSQRRHRRWEEGFAKVAGDAPVDGAAGPAREPGIRGADPAGSGPAAGSAGRGAQEAERRRSG